MNYIKMPCNATANTQYTANRFPALRLDGKLESLLDPLWAAEWTMGYIASKETCCTRTLGFGFVCQRTKRLHLHYALHQQSCGALRVARSMMYDVLVLK
jgi:hypothetical protein